MRRIVVTLAAMLAVSALSAAETAGPSEADIDRRAAQLVRKLTLEEKIDLLGGVDGFDVPGAPRIGLPVMHTADGPFGLGAMRGRVVCISIWRPA